MAVVLSRLIRRVLLFLGVPTLLLVLVAMGLSWNAERKASRTLPLFFEITPPTRMIVEKVLVTQHEKYSMLRLRCRWVGENMSSAYRVRLGIEDFGHLESRAGYSWCVSVAKDEQPGHRFSLDVKNPPHALLPPSLRSALPLPVKLDFRYREGTYSPSRESLKFVIAPQDIDYVVVPPHQIAAW